MVISNRETAFCGCPVREYAPEEGITDPTGTAYRLSIGYDEHEAGMKFAELLDKFLSDPATGRVWALVIGDWGGAAEGNDAGPVVEALVTARPRLTGLNALFLGEMTFEESEISWIQLADVSPLWQAYPRLEHFRIRGGAGLTLGTLEHPSLRSLVIESGGLAAEVVREVGRAALPELDHLELWLGDSGYGGDATPMDLVPILNGRFPKLRYLGLRNSCIADEVAAAAARALVLQGLETLDLSLGTLGDEGAAALLASPGVARLKMLDIHHHYVSEATVQKLKRLSIQVDASDGKEPDEDDGEENRYVAVAE